MRCFILTLMIVGGFMALSGEACAAESNVKNYEADGAVTAVSPLFSRISIKHEAIKNFAADRETEFMVTSKDLLKNISKGDMVHFRIVDNRGDVRIDKIQKTGLAPKEDDDLPLGRTVQGVLRETGNAVNTMTKPITPVNQVASGAMDATTNATDPVMSDANPEVKSKF